jgi:hypothetical protein
MQAHICSTCLRHCGVELDHLDATAEHAHRQMLAVGGECAATCTVARRCQLDDAQRLCWRCRQVVHRQSKFAVSWNGWRAALVHWLDQTWHRTILAAHHYWKAKVEAMQMTCPSSCSACCPSTTTYQPQPGHHRATSPRLSSAHLAGCGAPDHDRIAVTRCSEHVWVHGVGCQAPQLGPLPMHQHLWRCIHLPHITGRAA